MDFSSLPSSLQTAILDYQAKVGEFLQTGAQAQRIGQQAGDYANSSQPEVAQRAQAIQERATVLVSQFNATETQAVAALQKAQSVQASMQNNSLWRNIMSANLSSAGSAVLSYATNLYSQIKGAISGLDAINSQMNAQIKNVGNLQDDLNNLNDYAQGKGILAPLSKMVTATGGSIFGLVGNLGSSLKYVGIAAGVLLAVVGLSYAHRGKS